MDAARTRLAGHHGQLRSCAISLVASLLLFGTGLVAPVPSRAEAQGSRDWRVSLTIGAMIQSQKFEGRGESTFAASESFESIVRDDPVVVIPVIPFGLQAEAPTLDDVFGLRPFVHGRFVIPADEARTLARQGTIPNDVVIPTPFPASIDADAISGQGTLVRAVLGIAGQVGVGLSMDMPVAGLPARLGLSADYLVQRATIKGNVVRVTEPVVTDPRSFLVQRIGGEEETFFHYLGPRVDLEFPVWEDGQIEVSVLGEVASFFSVGDRSKSFTATDGIDSAAFEAAVDPWVLHAGVALRISWKGLR